MTKIKIRKEKMYFVLALLSIVIGQLLLLVGLALAIFVLYKIGDNGEKTTKTICYVSIIVNSILFIINFLSSSYYIF